MPSSLSEMAAGYQRVVDEYRVATRAQTITPSDRTISRASAWVQEVVHREDEVTWFDTAVWENPRASEPEPVVSRRVRPYDLSISQQVVVPVITSKGVSNISILFFKEKIICQDL